jgi:cell wall-active antibiotic response 4TMS protein YvqF
MRYRSFFWPAILIVFGLLALGANLGAISGENLHRLADLWPLILVVIGLVMICRRAFQGTTRDLAAILVVLVAVVGAAAYVAVRGPVPNDTRTLDTSDRVGSLSQATLHVAAGAATLKVDGSNALGADLYRAHLEFSGPKPIVTLDRSTGDLTISHNDDYAFLGGRRFVLALQVSSAVAWNITVDTGAANTALNLSALKVGSINVNTGASRDEITLGAPTGIVPISVDGGALTVTVHRPAGTEASVQVSGGAVNLSADGRQYHGIGDQSWKTDGYDQAAAAYRVEVNGGASRVTMDTAGAQ